MFYRDYMQKFRPAYAPDGVGDGAAPAAGTTPAAAPAAGEAATAPAALDAGAAAAPNSSGAPAPDAAAAPAEAAALTPESQPSLIEAAAGKPKKEAEAAAAPAPDAAITDPKTDEPAPAAADKTDAEKTAEAEAAAATDPATKDATAEAQPPAPIKYEAFKVPEGLKLDDERIGKFAEIAGPAQVNQEVAQKLLDLHVEEIQRVGKEAIDAAAANQRKSWNSYVDTITTELRKDPELGGNRLETSLSMAKAVIEEYLPANEAAEYLGLLRHNGMGNHRLQVKLLHQIGKVLNIFEDGMVPANPQAPKAQKSPGNRGWYNTPGNAAS